MHTIMSKDNLWRWAKVSDDIIEVVLVDLPEAHEKAAKSRKSDDNFNIYSDDNIVSSSDLFKY